MDIDWTKTSFIALVACIALVSAVYMVAAFKADAAWTPPTTSYLKGVSVVTQPEPVIVPLPTTEVTHITGPDTYAHPWDDVSDEDQYRVGHARLNADSQNQPTPGSYRHTRHEWLHPSWYHPYNQHRDNNHRD
jgi:hypothetical protein